MNAHQFLISTKNSIGGVQNEIKRHAVQGTPWRSFELKLFSCGSCRQPVRKPHSGKFSVFFSANVVAAAVTVVGAVVVAAVVVIAAAAEPEHKKDNDNPAAVAAIAKIKTTVHRDFSFNNVF